MEARKVIQFGNSSHVVSIPKSWIKENRLKKGDFIFLKRNSNGELILLPKEKKAEKREKKIIIEIDGKDSKTIKRELISAYLNNYSLIAFVGKSLKNNDVFIKKNLDSLVGIELVEQSSKELVAKDILDVAEAPLNDLVRRMDNILRVMFLELRETLEKKQLKKKNKLIELEQDVDKLNFLIWRLVKKSLEDQRILKSLNLEMKDVINILILVVNLEHLGDKLKQTANLISAINSAEKNKLKILCLDLEYLYLESMKAFYKSDKELAQKIPQKRKEFVKKCDSLGKRALAIRLGENLKQIQNLTYQINKLTLNL